MVGKGRLVFEGRFWKGEMCCIVLYPDDSLAIVRLKRGGMM